MFFDWLIAVNQSNVSRSATFVVKIEPLSIYCYCYDIVGSLFTFVFSLNDKQMKCFVKISYWIVIEIFFSFSRFIWTVLNVQCAACEKKRTISVEDQESDECCSSKVNNIQRSGGDSSRLSVCSRQLRKKTKRRQTSSIHTHIQGRLRWT